MAGLERPRIPWGLAALMLIEAALVAALGVALASGAPTWLTAPLSFLLLRLVADLGKAFGGHTALGTAVDGHLRALSWPALGLGLWSHLGDTVPLWAWGAGILLAGLSLWGHHSQAARASAGVAREEGLLGAWSSVAGAGLAATVFRPPPPWDLLVPVIVAVLTGVFAVRATVRLLGRSRSDPATHATTGWSAWYQEHFFRLTVILVALVAYLFVRDTVRGFVPFLTLFEWAAATTVIGVVLWTLRNHLRRRLVEHPVQSLHRRHTRQLNRHGEPEFDAIETAVGQFLDDGDTEAVTAMTRHMQDEGLPIGDAFAPVLSYTRRTDLLLVHPAWLYTARLVAILLTASAVALVAPTPVAVLVFGGGLWLAQFNRFGGPWWIKSGMAVAAWLLMVLALGSTGGPPSVLLGLPLSIWLALGLLLPAIVHPLRARKGRPVPLYAYQGTDPTPAIDRLRKMAERSLLHRGIWLAAVGVLVVLILGEVTQVFPEAAVLLNVYLLLALLVLVTPVLRTIGLRLGRAQVTRRHAQERVERERRVATALDAARRVLVP